MPIGSLLNAKELASTYKPLMLVEITLVTGQVLRYSTDPLSVTYGGNPAAGSYEYGGHPWYPRVLDQEIGASQMMSDIGIATPPSVTVRLADPKKEVFAVEKAIGFRGATLKLYQIMWDAGDTTTGSFNTDVPFVRFVGTCDGASSDESSISINATSLLNMASVQMPPVKVQPTCPWIYPISYAQRASAAFMPESRSYECGYSADIVGGKGNLNGTAAYTSCNYSFAACVERMGNSTPATGYVSIERDQHGNFTGRFGGSQWVPSLNGGLQRSYTGNKWEQITNASTEARYGDFVPMCYGTTWVEPLVMGAATDGNYTNLEVLLCFGNVHQILRVVVDGTIVCKYSGTNGAGDSDPGHRPDDPYGIASPIDNTADKENNWWKTVNNGSRNGCPNPNTGWGRQGDPYGSLAVIHVHCLRQLVDQGQIPQIQVLLRGGAVRTYTTPTSYYDGDIYGASNPAWILMDLLIWANWSYSQLDIQSFIDAAAICNQQIYYTRMDGTYANTYADSSTPPNYNPGNPPYKRYEIGFSVRNRTAVSEVIKGVMNSMRAMLYFDFRTGLLKLVNKQTIAEQQTTVVAGSNYTSPVPSVLSDGTLANGYVAYHFDERSILKKNNHTTLQVTQLRNQEIPSKVTIPINNRENGYSPDSATVINTEDVARMNTEVSGTMSLVGTQTFDHTRRCVNSWFAENCRGNERYDYTGSGIGDTGGTLQFSFETTIKCVHLNIGDICLFSDAQHGVSLQPCRVTRLKPSINGETWQVTMVWHNDNWYQDSFGQVNQPKYATPRPVVAKKPMPWHPGALYPAWPILNPDCGFYAQYQYVGAGNSSYSSQLSIAGVLPSNSFPNSPGRPVPELAGNCIPGSSSGASARSVFFGLVEKDTTAAFASAMPPRTSALSRLASVYNGPTATFDATVGFNVLAWSDNPGGYYLFAGRDSNDLSFVSESTGTPAGISMPYSTINPDLNWSKTFGPPDEAFSMMRVKLARAFTPGIWTLPCVSAAVSSPLSLPASIYLKMKLPTGVNFTTDQFAGRTISCLGYDTLGTVAGGEVQPIANLPLTVVATNPIADLGVIGNNSDTITASFNSLVFTPPYSWLGGGSGDFWASLQASLGQVSNTFAMRIAPTFGTDSTGNYFEDSLFVNVVKRPKKAVTVLDATNASPIVVKAPGHGLINGDICLVRGVEGNTAANGQFTVAVSGDYVTLTGSTGSGTYTTGGVLFSVYDGLDTNELAGCLAFVWAGTGKGTSVPIESNTSTRVYIQGDWPVTPDSTTMITVIDSTNVVDKLTQPFRIGVLSPATINMPVTVDTGSVGKDVTTLVRVSMVSSNLQESQETFDPFREVQCYNSLAFDGSVSMTLAGMLSIGSNQVPPVTVPKTVRPVLIVAQLKAPPGGANATIEIRCGGTLISTLDFADSGYILEVDSSPVAVTVPAQLDRLDRLVAGAPITLDITSAGTTYPGKDLTVTIYYVSVS